MAISMAAIAQGDQRMVGVAPRGKLVPCALAAVILSVVHLQEIGASTMPALAAIALKDPLALGPPLVLPEQCAIGPFDQRHGRCVFKRWAEPS